MKNFPLAGLWLLLIILFIIAWRLDLPEGGPRLAAFAVIVLVGIGTTVASVRAYNKPRN